MRVRKAGKGQIFRCGVGHHWPEALVIEGQEPAHLNGTYCLPCFGIRVVGRLAVPRADLIADPFGPVEAEPEPESGQDTPPAAEEEDPIERTEEVPEGQEADPDSGEAEGAEEQPTAEDAAAEPATGEPEGQGAGEEPAD